MKNRQPSRNRFTWFLTLGSGLLALILLGNWLNQQASLAAQGRPPEPRPAFGGVPVTAVLSDTANLPTETIPFTVQGPGGNKYLPKPLNQAFLARYGRYLMKMAPPMANINGVRKHTPIPPRQERVVPGL